MAINYKSLCFLVFALFYSLMGELQSNGQL